MSPSMQETMPLSAPQPEQMPAGTMAMQVDPVCRMQVDPVKARADGLFTELKGVTWFFDSAECKREFDDDPAVYLPVPR